MVARFLSRHKHALNWLHIAAVLGTLWLILPVIAWHASTDAGARTGVLIVVLATIAWSQNIGLIHHCDHVFPAGPRWLGRGTAVLLHSLGGLAFTSTRLAHGLHHAHLGTDLDPDRAGYQTTTTLLTRLRYLALIGPLRSRFAPVDLSAAFDRMSIVQRSAFAAACRRERLLSFILHGALACLTGRWYLALFVSLLLANVLGNVREIAEHGYNGRAAYVDIEPSPLGVLLFSTPGFWLHGLHHLDAGIHYLDLPLARRMQRGATDLPYLTRRSALGYLFTGR